MSLCWSPGALNATSEPFPLVWSPVEGASYTHAATRGHHLRKPKVDLALEVWSPSAAFCQRGGPGQIT